MLETEVQSYSRNAVTKTTSDAVIDSDSDRQTKVKRMLHKLKSVVLKGMTKLKGQQNPPSSFAADPVFDQHELGKYRHVTHIE